METAIYSNTEPLDRSLEEFKKATRLTRPDKALKFSSQIERFTTEEGGLDILIPYAIEADRIGYFEGTNWHEPGKLVPSLVRGTLLVGPPTSTMELMSDLRMLAIADGRYNHREISREEAAYYLEQVVVNNLDIALGVMNEEARMRLSKREFQKINLLFRYLLEHIPMDSMKERIADEIEIHCIQRPVETQKIVELIRLIKDRVKIVKNKAADKKLLYYINACFHPSKVSQGCETLEEYGEKLKKLSVQEIKKEAREMGEAMENTGLVSRFHSSLLIHILETHPESNSLIKAVLALTAGGEAQWEDHKSWLFTFIPELAIPGSKQYINGLSNILNKALLSRRAVKAGLNNMRNVKIHPVVTRQIRKSLPKSYGNTPVLPFVLSGTIRILGQPLGVSQGNNPTCQSARAISLWSQHAPAKLIDMIINVATQNRLLMRFENVELNSNHLGKGLVDQLDHDLDVVSAILVPHLDKIYNEMMRRAAGRIEDPHKWVNPAMYGQWIQTGFASAYDYTSNSIRDYNGFVQLFFNNFHPEYNGNKMMTYPSPLGIFITSSQAKMLGFHAISLLRVKKGQDGKMRAYFLNPNNEGRKNWGQEIRPTVYGNGEEAGESSLPFEELAARVYAFHFHPSIKTKKIKKVESKTIKKIRELAETSWGKQYLWSDIPAIW